MKSPLTLLACAASVAGWMILSPCAFAQTAISFSFGGATTADTMQTTDLAGAPGVRVGNWNNVANMSTTGNVATFPNGAIIQSNGASTGMLTATITTGTTNFGGNYSINGTAQTNDAQLYNGIFDQYNGTSTTISITNIPYTLYNVYFYMHTDTSDGSGGSTRAGSFTIGSTTLYARGGLADPTSTGTGYVQSTDTTGNGASTQQGNYVVFTNLTGNLTASFNTINAGNATLRSKVAGFEIVQVPEPGSLALMVCGGLGLLIGIQRVRRMKA